MAQYNGYRIVPHETYQQFRNTTLGSGWNVDYYANNQCWDLAALAYFQYGLSLVTRPGGYGTAADCWNISRAINSKTPFISLTGKENIKRGDILVWDRTAFTTTGHIAFADEDYNGTNYIDCLGQNQGQGKYGPANIANLSLNNFLGIFRNTRWQAPEPTPEFGGQTKKRKFPWVIAWNNWDNFKH